MTLSGWIFFALSWAFIIALNIFCFTKVFGKKEGEESSNGEESAARSQ